MKQTEYIRPGVVVNGETIYPPGWTFVLAFAIHGCQWAIDEVNTIEFKQRISDYNQLDDAYRINDQINLLERRLEALKNG